MRYIFESSNINENKAAFVLQRKDDIINFLKSPEAQTMLDNGELEFFQECVISIDVKRDFYKGRLEDTIHTIQDALKIIDNYELYPTAPYQLYVKYKKNIETKIYFLNKTRYFGANELDNLPIYPELYKKPGILVPVRIYTKEPVSNSTIKTNDPQIKEAIKFIKAGGQCAYQRGFSYKGATYKLISKEEALKLLPVYKFGKSMNELEYRNIDGVKTLFFNEYSIYDME